MKNWVGNLQFSPKKNASPTSIKEIQELILLAKNNNSIIRTRGSTHSWTGLIESKDMNQALHLLHSRLKKNRHLEMFYFPVGDWSMVKTMNETDNQMTTQGLAQKFNDVVLENLLYEGLNITAKYTNQYEKIDSIMRKFVSKQIKINWSHAAFPTDRSVKFMEMEYNLPLHKFNEVFDEIKNSIKVNQFKTLFPIEIRFVKGDPIWLSPAYERDSVYFAVHTYISEEWRPYFNVLKEIFVRHGGRPHWG